MLQFQVEMIKAFEKNISLPFEWRLQRYEVIDSRGKSVAPVRDLLYDDVAKAPRYVLIEIGGGIGVSGKMVLLPVEIIERGGNGLLLCEVSEEDMMGFPILKNSENPTRRDEERIFEHFKKEPYWLKDVAQEAPPEEGALPKTSPEKATTGENGE